MAWTVILSPAADKDAARLDGGVRARVGRAIQSLAVNPKPVGSISLRGSAQGEFRIRVGDWRVIYTVDHHSGIVRVLKIGHRREVYR